MVQRIAFLSVRLERCARQEAGEVGRKMRRASEKFIDQRMSDVEKMMDWIASEPASFARRLRGTPEGVDRLIAAWSDLDAVLAGPDRNAWAYGQWQPAGEPPGQEAGGPADVARRRVLCKAYWGEPEHLEPGEAEGMDKPALREWARGRLRERIAARLAEARQLRGTFDPANPAKDVEEAAQRAIFDDSKPATLARKYEAAAERGLYKALKELREGRGRGSPATRRK